MAIRVWQSTNIWKPIRKPKENDQHGVCSMSISFYSSGTSRMNQTLMPRNPKHRKRIGGHMLQCVYLKI